MISHSLLTFFWRAAFAFVVLGVLDMIRQQRRFTKSLRMSKQEIRDEMKESEGNPQIKARMRRLQRDLARRNMMKEVPNATAVIVNPTHYAVAIRYEMESMAAPRVVAKGKNYLALRIRADRDRATRCRSSRISRWRRRCTSPRTSGRRFRRTSIAPWPKCWPTSSS